MPPSAERVFAAIDATWAPAEIREADGWRLRRGAGGGQRVSCASAWPVGSIPQIAAAEAAMARWNQPPLFRLGDEPALDAALSAQGYRVVDPVAIYAAPVATLVDRADETARLIRVSTRLAVAEEIWAEGGIGPGRLAVMARVTGPRMTLLARVGDRPVGVAFVACDGGVAMIHAIEVRPAARRQGAGARLMRGAARWAAEVGADTLALAVTKSNGPACALYRGLGMVVAACYHYRARG